MNTNEIYLQKKLKVILPLPVFVEKYNNKLVATIGKNFESIGYIFSPKLFKELCKLTSNQLETFYKETLPILKKMRGAHKQYTPMYPNFPQQVINMSQYQLYCNAMIHYWSFWMKDLGIIQEVWLPEYEKEERLPLTEDVKMDVIDLGNECDFKNIFTKLVEAKSSISESDKDIITKFVVEYKNDVVNFLPETISTKEQLAFVSGLLLSHTTISGEMKRYIKTPTDVLRIVVVLSGGDVSLAEDTKFISFNRPQRRFLMGLLENCNTNLEEEMTNRLGSWLRLGERLHPGEYKKQFPRVFNAFKKIRNEKVYTFNSKVEIALENKEIKEFLKLLTTRPGDFARRLDHLARLSEKTRNGVVEEFLKVADKISTNVLLQLYTHFKNRNGYDSEFRPVFPKGNLAKIHVLEKELPPIRESVCRLITTQVRQTLINRFSKLEPLGNVYLDESLKNYLIPFSQRSASKALKTIVRGSQIPLDGDYDTIRFFIWWKNGDNRVDIDLTASILNEDFEHLNDISYYNLKDFEGHHSGDITSAPKGAAEFIDISMNRVQQSGGRYIVMGIYSYTQQSYCDLPECFAGWMGRKNSKSGEIFEAKTVKNKIDIASNTTVCLPLIIDVVERKVIWTDLSLKQLPTWNNARNNSNNIGLICKAMVNLKKPNLYDLMSMHVEARGKLVDNQKKADKVFSSETFPFEIDEILTKWV